MIKSRTLAILLVLLPLAAFASIGTLAPSDSVAGLKTALQQGATRAVAQLGVTDGFLKNPKVKIPLPPTLKKADKALRMLGMGGQADELVVAMNRAAEIAVPEAKVLLLDAVKQMSLDDARQILTGGDDSATQYFRRVSYDKLQQRFLPIVKEKTDHAQLAKQYNDLAARAAPFGLVEAKDATVEGYVTRKALDGLFVVIGDEERAIRRDPLGQSSKILRSVFGALGH